MTWNPDDGLLFDEDARQEIYAELGKDYVNGVTFSGGDPLHEANIKEITDLAREVKEKYPDKTIWLYTGSVWDEIKDLEVFDYVDVLVDGEFVEEKKDSTLHWKGSSNQMVIDVKNTKKTGEIVLHG